MVVDIGVWCDKCSRGLSAGLLGVGGDGKRSGYATLQRADCGRSNSARISHSDFRTVQYSRCSKRRTVVVGGIGLPLVEILDAA